MYTIERIKEHVHKPLNYSDYSSTNVRVNTNCYAHAIGSTYSDGEFYRIGAISGLKDREQQYFSEEEIKNLFLKDMQTLELKLEDLNISSKEDCLKKIRDTELNENQFIILLFVKYWASGKIGDFHFWRFDEKGFSEKRYGNFPNLIEKPEDYWYWKDKEIVLIGGFEVTR